MTFSTIVASCGLGVVSGILYGLLFSRQSLSVTRITPKSPDAQSVEDKKFPSFFIMPMARILLILPLWYYVLRSSSLSIILVLLAFLTGFWAVIIQKKVLNE